MSEWRENETDRQTQTQRERDREGQRQKDRQRQTDRETQTERQRQRQRERERERKTERATDRQIIGFNAQSTVTVISGHTQRAQGPGAGLCPVTVSSDGAMDRSQKTSRIPRLAVRCGVDNEAAAS